MILINGFFFAAKVITLIFSPDEDMDCLYRLPRDTSCDEVIRKWKKDRNPAYSVYLFTENSDLPLDGSKRLEDLSAACEGQVSLHAFPKEITVAFQLLGSSDSLSLSISSSVLPSELTPQLRELFELPYEQKFRLKVGQTVLDDRKAVWRQDVTEDKVVALEMEYSGEIRDRNTDEFVTDFSLFADDRASQLKCPPYMAVQRFWFENRLLPQPSGQQTVSEVFKDMPAPYGIKLQVSGEPCMMLNRLLTNLLSCFCFRWSVNSRCVGCTV